MQDVPKRRFNTKDILDALPELKKFIEDSKLLHVLKARGKPEMIDGKPVISMFSHVPTTVLSDEITMHLKDDIQINTAYDLPLELVQNFYYNSPFFNLRLPSDSLQTEYYESIKQIGNE